MITLDEYCRGFPGTPDPLIVYNAKILLRKVNKLLDLVVLKHPGFKVKMTSGLRTRIQNAGISGAAPNSKHLTGQAIDIGDGGPRTLAKWCVAHKEELARLYLWCEDPRATPTWVHFQSLPPASGARFFIPSAAWAKKLGEVPLTLAYLVAAGQIPSEKVADRAPPIKPQW